MIATDELSISADVANSWVSVVAPDPPFSLEMTTIFPGERVIIVSGFSLYSVEPWRVRP